MKDHVNMNKTTVRVRKYHGVPYVAKGNVPPATFKDPTTCGHCGRTWDDSVITDWTPVPSARCPLEYMHRYRGGNA